MKQIALLTCLALTPGVLLAESPRVAVAHFDFATVRSMVTEIFGGEVDLGKGIADMVEAKMVESGQFRVYERRRLDVVMGEQEDSNSSRFDSRTAIKLGQLTGAEYVVLGSITRLGRDDGRKGFDAGSWLWPRIPGGNIVIGKGEAKAVVGLTLKLVNARTGEIILSSDAIGESKRKSKTLGGLVGLGGRSVWGNAEMTAQNFGATILGEAASDASTKLTQQLAAPATLARLKTAPASELKVARISDGSVYLAGGESTGLKVGDQVEIHQIVEVIPDPDDPARPLDVITRKVGVATILEVRERMTVARLDGKVQARTEDQFIARRKG
jgi:curli biogenesis system outer membrane secretion channel CsgG